MTLETRLLVDVGNSRIKWNLVSAGATHLTNQTRAIEWNIESLNSLLDKYWGNIDASNCAISIANVAGNLVRQSITDWCNNHWQRQPRFFSTAAEFDALKNGYQDYHQLGVDRWLAIIAAQNLYPQQTVIVIDCGTAITVDTVLANGQHRAGPILAGRKMVFDALSGGTAFGKNWKNPGASSLEVFVSTTEKAVKSGVNFATAKALDAVIEQIRRELSEQGMQQTIQIITTGGAVPEIVPLMNPEAYCHEPDLVLQGILIVSAKDS